MDSKGGATLNFEFYKKLSCEKVRQWALSDFLTFDKRKFWPKHNVFDFFEHL